MTRTLSNIAFASTAALALAACAEPAEPTSYDADSSAVSTLASDNITEASFGCIRDLTQVDRFFVGNLDGDLDATVAVASSEDGGVFPVGSVVQLVPGEAMVKRANGFNAATESYEDLIKAGVIDPTKVVRTSLQNAASVSGLLLTTEAMIAEKPEPKGAGGGGGGMPDMGGMGGMGGMM